MNITLKQHIFENEITKNYLKNTPLDERLPKGYEIKFKRRGMFFKYLSIENAINRNKSKYFTKDFDKLKLLMNDGDEI